ncbi:helix-turn-helix domain-containing protein [Nocardioides alkalitolerans]|uniref:helix-turn-helix transcriptional regulator n=1 Tax=Nocardioides alkalitolerans TaxID=281714 RepID=UPI000A02EAF3
MPRPQSTPEQLARAGRLGRRLSALRRQAGLSQEALARLANVSTETVRKIEQGKTASPELFTFAALMDHLASTIDEVIEHVR